MEKEKQFALIGGIVKRDFSLAFLRRNEVAA